MKTRTRILAAVITLLLPFVLQAQCVTPLNIVTFDTTVTGSGNAFHTFTFPKFDPSLGTLVEVNLKLEVTLKYRFQLENRENIAINNYRVRVVRDDEISGPALQTPFTHTQQVTYGPYSLAANDGAAGAGADYINIGPLYAMNHQLSETTVYNTADFLGNGNVSLDYFSSTYSIVFGSVNYNYNGTAEDTARLIVTYRYCDTWFLADKDLPQRARETKKKQNGLGIYPNPSNGSFNVLFSNTKRADWQVTVTTLQGQVIGQYQFTRALVGKINLQQQVAKGMYIIKAVNKRTDEQFGAQLFIR